MCRGPLNKVEFLLLHAFIRLVMIIQHSTGNRKYPETTVKVLRFEKYATLIAMSQIFTRTLCISYASHWKTKSVHLIQFHYQNTRDIQNFVPEERPKKTQTVISPASQIPPPPPLPKRRPVTAGRPLRWSSLRNWGSTARPWKRRGVASVEQGQGQLSRHRGSYEQMQE